MYQHLSVELTPVFRKYGVSAAGKSSCVHKPGNICKCCRQMPMLPEQDAMGRGDGRAGWHESTGLAGADSLLEQLGD